MELRSTPSGERESAAAQASGLVAVVLNWNGGDETLACLRSVRASEGVDVLPLLADNGSEDGSVELALAEDPELLVQRYGSNLGYAGGNNRAVRYALSELGARWVCLLNSDVELRPDTLARLLEGAGEAADQAAPEVGAVGPCLVYAHEPEVIWACGGRVGPIFNVTQLLDHGRRRDAEHAAGAPFAVDYLPGACLLVSRAACEATGLLDEDFFCYLEDADWGLRMAGAGFRQVVVPAAEARHGLSSSTGGGYSAGRKYMTGVNSVHFLRKHPTVSGWAALFLFDLLLWPLTLVRGMLSGRTAGAVAKLRGLIDGLRGQRVDATVAARFSRRAR